MCLLIDPYAFRESRRANSQLRSNKLTDPLHTIYKTDGTISALFPRDVKSLFSMDGTYPAWSSQPQTILLIYLLVTSRDCDTTLGRIRHVGRLNDAGTQRESVHAVLRSVLSAGAPGVFLIVVVYCLITPFSESHCPSLTYEARCAAPFKWSCKQLGRCSSCL